MSVQGPTPNVLELVAQFLYLHLLALVCVSRVMVSFLFGVEFCGRCSAAVFSGRTYATHSNVIKYIPQKAVFCPQ
ncbi:MAG: hypothetical protein ACQEUB_04350 [Thermodesulfobacteriota bacterium]